MTVWSSGAFPFPTDLIEELGLERLNSAKTSSKVNEFQSDIKSYQARLSPKLSGRDL